VPHEGLADGRGVPELSAEVLADGVVDGRDGPAGGHELPGLAAAQRPDRQGVPDVVDVEAAAVEVGDGALRAPVVVRQRLLDGPGDVGFSVRRAASASARGPRGAAISSRLPSRSKPGDASRPSSTSPGRSATATSRWVPTKPSQTSSRSTVARRVELRRPVRFSKTSSMENPCRYHAPEVTQESASASSPTGASKPIETSGYDDRPTNTDGAVEPTTASSANVPSNRVLAASRWSVMT
jgi:hypothetical protein